MKTSLHILLAALAATVVLAGCVQEITPPSFENDKVNPASKSSRVIAVSFAAQPQTKTALDGFQPKFEDGKDTVLISNTNALDTCVVSVKDNKATISTNLTGPLTAVYPYKAAGLNGNNSTQIDTVLVFTEQSGKFASANICIARMTGENEESLSFENKTAVFCIKPPTNSPGYVEVSAEGFDIANHIPTGSTNTDYSAIRVPSVTTDSVYVSILVPDGLKVNNLKFSDGTKEKAITTGAQATEEIAAGTLYTVDNENWESPEADTPEGALAGVFSVSADKQVHFSQGNLTYDVEATTNKWKFYEHQYDCAANGDASSTLISLFTWGYGTWSTSPDGTDYQTGDFTDWGSQIGDGNTWRTLTIAEWAYLLNTRTDAKNKVGYATVSGVHGIILLPDTFTDPKKNNGIDEFFPASEGKGWESNIYTAGDNWNAMELAGAVFLPAAGVRDGSTVDDVDEDDHYWSSSSSIIDYSEEARSIRFTKGRISSSVSTSRALGSSVRLVTDVSAAPTPTEPDYVEITAKYDGEDQPARALKWATKNLAITDSGKKSWKGGNESAVKVPGTNEDVIVGDYFQWAASYSGYGITEDSHKVIDSLLIYTAFTNSGCGDSENNLTYKSAGAGKTYQFDTESDDSHIGISPYYSGSAYSKYTSSSQPTLQRTPDNDDVASIILGGTWRMHTSAEFQALCNVTYWAWDDTDKGYYVYTPNPESDAGKVNEGGSGEYNKSAALLFFPAAGGVDYIGLGFVGSYGYYWSNSLGTDTDRAYNLEFEDSSVEPQSNIVRYAGFSVRPVSD